MKLPTKNDLFMMPVSELETRKTILLQKHLQRKNTRLALNMLLDIMAVLNYKKSNLSI